MTRLNIGYTFVRDLTVLHPKMQEVECGERCIRRIAQKLPHVIKDDQIPSVVDEWKLYQHQEIPEDWYKTDETGSTRIDHHWVKVFQKKTLSGAELTLSHGNADVERSLSVNKQDTFDSRVTEWHQTSERYSGC